ncbi:MAG: DUF1934 family protein [Candidatus Izemoplasmatales bacterium]|jgi:uncharacterized beta-barrel protein YwiB (DUF1934 family)|nr:DUF1934 family protein [Candidatus Izemoplasmatales bacterium]
MKNAKIGFSMAINGTEFTAFEVVGTVVSNGLIFTDTENNDYQIDIISPTVSITKTGTITSKMAFQNQSITTGIIRMADAYIDLTIKTQRLKIAFNAIDIIYDLLDDDVVISQHHLHLYWQLDTERKEN